MENLLQNMDPSMGLHVGPKQPYWGPYFGPSGTQHGSDFADPIFYSRFYIIAFAALRFQMGELARPNGAPNGPQLL